ncbi:MAG: GxxExxY protein [Planctomycetaceae bacterium]|nr:GxxExxY protein [Planctomycetaceae bacterium]
MNINDVTGQIIDAAMKVHTVLGPGLLESAYEVCLVHELRSRGLNVQAQVLLPIEYEGLKLDAGYRIDLLVEETVIVELKAVEKILPLYEAQILSYLRLRNLEVGLLINFNVMRLKDGLKRIVNNYSGPTPRSSAPSAVNLSPDFLEKDFQ